MSLFANIAEMGNNTLIKMNLVEATMHQEVMLASLDLRDIGTGNTLNLLNGRRLVQFSRLCNRTYFRWKSIPVMTSVTPI